MATSSFTVSLFFPPHSVDGAAAVGEGKGAKSKEEGGGGGGGAEVASCKLQGLAFFQIFAAATGRGKPRGKFQ